jgi:hypothetical protein
MRELSAAVLRKIRSPVLLIILLPVVMFGRALQHGRVFSAADNLFFFYPWLTLEPGAVPQNSLLGDRTFQFEPWLIYASTEIRSGRFPLWNPHSYAGAPLLGNAQSALLFPLTALAYVLPVHAALGLEAILKIMMAGLSMYWMLRVLALQPLAALAGALAFMFNGFLIVWLGWPQTNVGIWLPLLVGLTERLRDTGTWRYTGWLAVVVAVQFLGGHPETSFFLLVVMALYALYRLRGPAAGRFLAQFAAAGAIGGLLAAVQLLPFLDYLSRSAVFFYRRETHIIALSPRAIIALLIPNYFGSPASRNFWGPANYNEISGSVGVIPWILAPCALLGAWKKRGTKFFLSLIVLIGTVVYNVRPFPWALSRLPGFSKADNIRLILVFTFSLAALCGIGMEVLIKPPPKARSRIIIGVFLLFLLLSTISIANVIADHKTILGKGLTEFVAYQCGAFALLLVAGTLITIYSLWRGTCTATLGGCLLAVEVLSILSFAPSYNPIIETNTFYPLPAALAYLQRDRSLFRVLLNVPNIGAVYGLSDIVGYDAMVPRHLEQLVDPAQSVGPMASEWLKFTDDMNSQIFDLVNLKYILLPPGAPSPGPKFRLEYDGPDSRIYRNAKVFPRAFLVSRARTCLNDDAALALVRGGKIDLENEVVIGGCRQLMSADSPQVIPEVQRYEPERVVVHANVHNAAFLVLTDTYDPGWQVWVDGREADLLVADYAFRAVALGAGSHTVVFLYRPLMFHVGLLLSIVALFGTVALFLIG